MAVQHRVKTQARCILTVTGSYWTSGEQKNLAENLISSTLALTLTVVRIERRPRIERLVVIFGTDVSIKGSGRRRVNIPVGFSLSSDSSSSSELSRFLVTSYLESNTGGGGLTGNIPVGFALS